MNNDVYKVAAEPTANGVVRMSVLYVTGCTISSRSVAVTFKFLPRASGRVAQQNFNNVGQLDW